MSFWTGYEAICRPDAALAGLTWFKLGGPARWLLSPRDEAELVGVLRRCAEFSIPWRVLGKGANLLVRDAGFDGAVIRLVGPGWEAVEWDADCPAPEDRGGGTAVLQETAVCVRAGAGADFPKLVKAACNRGYAGLENLAGIPGTLGGIIRMNAGGKYGAIAQFVRGVRVLDANGDICDMTRDEVGFAYRRTRLGGCVVLGATLELRRDEPALVVARFREIWNEKHAAQPAVSERTAGCVFKNPPQGGGSTLSAGALLDRAGLKGLRVGGAEISPRHANFIVAGDGATAADVLELMDLARQRVREMTGVELEREVEVW